MNKTRSLLHWPQLVFVFVVFSVMLILALFFQDTLRETVLVSILYLIWVGKLAIQSFDQRCIWQLAIVITLVLTLIFSLRKFGKSILNFEVTERRDSVNYSRIQFWRSEIRVAGSAVFARRSRPSNLRRLVITGLAYRDHMDIKEINKQLRSRKLQVPPELRSILGVDDAQERAEQRPGILSLIRQKFNGLRRNSFDPELLPDPRLDEVASYLESLMEDYHDI